MSSCGAETVGEDEADREGAAAAVVEQIGV